MIKYEFLKVTPTYTGGGIYVIDGALKNGLFFVASPSDGFTEILDADGSEKDNNGDQVMYDSEWIELHRVNTLVDGNDNDSFMCDLCEWIINNRPNGNYAFSDIKKIHSDYLDVKMAEKMKHFDTMDQALEYSQENIGKYNYEIVEIGNERCILSSTCLPFEELIRNKIESMLTEVLQIAGIPEDSSSMDVVCSMGAELESHIEAEIEKQLRIKFVSNYLDF